MSHEERIAELEAELANEWVYAESLLIDIEDLRDELEAARAEAKHWRVKAEEYRFDNRGDW